MVSSKIEASIPVVYIEIYLAATKMRLLEQILDSVRFRFRIDSGASKAGRKNIEASVRRFTNLQFQGATHGTIRQN